MSSNLTIVGPQSEKPRYKSKYNSIRFEAMLLMAKYNKKFRKALISNREKAVEQSGIRLDENEVRLLFSIDNKSLLKSIKVFSIPGVKRRTLPTWKAAAAVIFLISFIQQGHAIEKITDFVPRRELVMTSSVSSGFKIRKIAKQESKVTGVVTDSISGEPLPGVNIQIQGTTDGTITELDGTYSIDADSGNVLVFSYVGYLSKSLVFTGQEIIDIKLQLDPLMDEEIIVISYGHSPSKFRRFLRKFGVKYK